jgi:hypothetical protein
MNAAAFAMDAMIRTHLERGEPLLDLLVERDSWLRASQHVSAVDVYNYLVNAGVLDDLTPLESYERVLAGLELIRSAEESADADTVASSEEEEEEEEEEDEFDFQDSLDYEEYLEYLHQYD